MKGGSRLLPSIVHHIVSPSKAHVLHFHPSQGNSSHTGSTAKPAPDGGPLDAGADSTNLIWRVLLEGRLSPDELLINISTNQLLTEGDSLFSSEVGLSSLERGGPFDLNDTMEFTLGYKRNDSGDHTNQNRTVQSGGRTSNRSNRTRYQSELTSEGWPGSNCL